MSIQLMTDRERWDALLDGSPDGLLFHKWRFLGLVERHSGYRWLPLGCYWGGELMAVIPLFYRRRLGVNMVFSPPPQTGVPYLGFAFKAEYAGLKPMRQEEIFRLMVEELEQYLHSLRPDFVSISLHPGWRDVRPFLWEGYQAVPGFTYLLSLERPLAEIWDGLNSNLRNRIRKARKDDLRVVPAVDPAGVFGLLQRRYQEQGLRLPLFSAAYLAELLAAFPEELRVYAICAGDDPAPLSMMICHEYKRFLLWLGGSRIPGASEGNYLAMWEMLVRAQAAGMSEFDFSGAGQQNLSHFKAQFNSRLEVAFTVQKKGRLGRAAEWGYQNFIKRL